MLATASVDSQIAVGIALAVVGFVLSIIGTLVAVYFGRIQKDISSVEARITDTATKMEERITTNGRHLDSVMHTTWELIWRVSSMEDFLDDTTQYRPIKNVPKMGEP